MEDSPAVGVEQCKVFVYRRDGFSEESTTVVQEVYLRIFFNGNEMVTIACGGNCMRELAVGFLRSEGFIESASNINRIDMSDDGRIVHVFAKDEIPPPHDGPCAPEIIASSGDRSRKRKESVQYRDDLLAQKVYISIENVFGLMEKFVEMSHLHNVTGGTHSAALAQGDRILAVREDIGRHNAIDMVGGYTLLNEIDCSDKIILRTGRISAEIVHKIWRLNVPVMISLSVPTSMAIEMCKDMGMTLIGSVRGGKMNVYSHEWRIRN